MISVAITNNLSSLGCRLLMQLIQLCGGLPILIPCFLPMATNQPKAVLLAQHLVRVETLLSQCKAIIIPGNPFDINPEVYGEMDVHPETEQCLCHDPFNVRFETELLMARYALNNKLPFIGICGGMHIFNVALGGTLIQHLPDHLQLHKQHQAHFDNSWSPIVKKELPEWENQFLAHLQTNTPSVLPFDDSHTISVIRNSILGFLYKQKHTDLSKIYELSLHHQGCCMQQLADQFEAIAYAPDGVIEAAQLKKYPTIGLLTQFHWEYNLGGIAFPLMQMLIAHAKKINLSSVSDHELLRVTVQL